MPKHVHEARPIVPVTKSTPKDPQELFEPFNLASLDRHNKQVRPPVLLPSAGLVPSWHQHSAAKSS